MFRRYWSIMVQLLSNSFFKNNSHHWIPFTFSYWHLSIKPFSTPLNCWLVCVALNTSLWSVVALISCAQRQFVMQQLVLVEEVLQLIFILYICPDVGQAVMRLIFTGTPPTVSWCQIPTVCWNSGIFHHVLEHASLNTQLWRRLRSSQLRAGLDRYLRIKLHSFRIYATSCYKHSKLLNLSPCSVAFTV